jgi:hypothetical protein
MKVLLQTKRAGEQWKRVTREFVALPRVGEFVGLAAGDDWCRVVLVTHYPPGMVFDAEVFAMFAGKPHLVLVLELGPDGSTAESTSA